MKVPLIHYDALYIYSNLFYIYPPTHPPTTTCALRRQPQRPLRS